MSPKNIPNDELKAVEAFFKSSLFPAEYDNLIACLKYMGYTLRQWIKLTGSTSATVFQSKDITSEIVPANLAQIQNNELLKIFAEKFSSFNEEEAEKFQTALETVLNICGRIRYIATKHIESLGYQKEAYILNKNVLDTIEEVDSRFFLPPDPLTELMKKHINKDVDRLAEFSTSDNSIQIIEEIPVPYYWNSTVPALRSFGATLIIVGVIKYDPKDLDKFVKSWDRFGDKNNRISTNLSVPEVLYLLYRVYGSTHFKKTRIDKITNSIFNIETSKNPSSIKAMFNDFNTRLKDPNTFDDYVEKKLLQAKKIADYFDSQVKR